MSNVKKLPTRDQVPVEDRWNLSSLFPNDEAWEAEFVRWEAEIPQYQQFSGTPSGTGRPCASTT